MSELKSKAEVIKKQKVRDEMNFSREKQFLGEQLKAVRTALKASQMECDLIKKELDAEVSLNNFNLYEGWDLISMQNVSCA